MEAMNHNLLRIIGITFIVKICVLLFIALGYHCFAFQTGNYLANFHDPAQEIPSLQTAYQTWDAQHYLYLAAHGYSPNHLSNVFFPLWPLLIRWCTPPAGGISWLAGLGLSQLFALVATAYFYLLVKNLWDEPIAFRACIWSLAFPTAFYSGLIYTESLFWLLTMVFFYYSLKNRWGASTLGAFLLPLARPTGILEAASALAGWGNRKDTREEPFLPRIITALAFCVGFGLYLFLMKEWTGDSFSGFSAQKFYISHSGWSNLLNPFGWLFRNFIQNPYTMTGTHTCFLPRVFLIVVMLSLTPLYKQVSPNFFVYTLMLGLFPAFSGDILSMSYMRYTAILFPIFILAALKIGVGGKVLLVCCFLAQAFLLIAHSLNYWAG
jgi:hypothetical protein